MQPNLSYEAAVKVFFIGWMIEYFCKLLNEEIWKRDEARVGAD